MKKRIFYLKRMSQRLSGGAFTVLQIIEICQVNKYIKLCSGNAQWRYINCRIARIAIRIRLNKSKMGVTIYTHFEPITIHEYISNKEPLFAN